MRVETGISEMESLNLGKKDIRDGKTVGGKGEGRALGPVAFSDYSDIWIAPPFITSLSLSLSLISSIHNLIILQYIS